MKRLILTLSLVCLTISGWAEQISREQALRQAQSFFSKKGIFRTLISAETQLSRHRAQGSLQADCYYVFNAGQNEGFVIISGDDRTEAVLGYAEQGSFDVDNIPPAMAELLNHYAEQIEAIRNGASPAPRRAAHLQVPTFMTVKWNQYEPYNNKTPLGYYTNKTEGVHCVTGCVATAMAQVLYHQHFVNTTQAAISGYQNHYYWKSPTGDKYAYLEDVPAGTALDWGNMVDSYGGSESEAQKEAVANLMLYCGTAVKMVYNISASTASVASVPDAFKTYFGYSSGTRYVQRNNYSDSEWDDLIYHEISSLRPVIYGGQTSGKSGHAFILHGYDGDGKYAVNWGWGGQSDGFFTLNNLAPPKQGAGGASGGYKYDQEAVIHLLKEDGSFSETVKATVTASKIGDFQIDSNGYLVMPTQTSYSATKDSWGRVPFSLAITFKSTLVNFYTMDCGYGIHNSSGQLIGNVIKMRTAEFKNGTGWTFATGNSAFGGDLSVGTYYVKGYSKQSTASDWLLCDDANKFAVKIDVTASNMSFSVVDISSLNPDPQPEVTDADRVALANTYSSLESAVNAKQKAIDDNETDISAIKATITKLKETIDAIDSAVNAIKDKLKDDTYLSESQKTEFETQLTTLQDLESQKKSELEAIYVKLITAESSISSLKTQLSTLLSQISEQASAVAGITTKEALNAAQTLADQMIATANGIDVASVTTQIQDVKDVLNDISFTSIQTDLSDLGEAIDKAIADAIAAAEAEQAEKEKAEFEAAKNSMNERIDAIIKAASDKVDALSANNNSIDALTTALTAASNDVTSVEAQINQLKLMLQDKYITDAQREELFEKVEEFHIELKTYEGSLNEISTLTANAETANANLIAKLQDIVKAIQEIASEFDAATKKADIDALAPKAEAIEASLKDVDPATVSSVAESLAADLKNLSLAGVKAKIADLANTIQTLIDTAKAEEEAAEQAEQEKKELEAAKASMQEVIDAISKTIADKAAAIEANDKVIADLKTALATASKDAKAVADQIDVITALLENKYLTETQKNNCLQQLDIYQKELGTYQKSLDDLTKKISAAETSNTALVAQIEDLKKATAELTTKVEAGTKKDDVEALKPDAEAIETKLKDIDAASVSNDLATLTTTLKALSLADTQKALTTLQETIQSVIDSAKSDEEKAKEEAEKLEKAKETYQVVADKLDEVISAHQEIYELLKDAHEKIGKAMTEIEVALDAMKIQYVGIEKTLEELIAKQPKTRADDDPIARLQERLKLLADNIATLESQYEQLSAQIALLGDHLEQYDALIEKATKTRAQLQDALASATTADDVDNMTALASSTTNELSTLGLDAYNQFLDDYTIVLDNLNAYIDNINTVYTQANTLQTDVEYEATSIQRVTIVESEVSDRYDMKGNRVDSTYKGVQIIRLKNGRTIKINVK